MPYCCTVELTNHNIPPDTFVICFSCHDTRHVSSQLRHRPGFRNETIIQQIGGIVRSKRDGTRAEIRFRLSPKRTSPFKSAGASVQSTAGSRGVRISVSNAGYTTFRGSVRVLATLSLRQFPLHFPSRASPCATRFQTHSTTCAANQFAQSPSCDYLSKQSTLGKSLIPSKSHRIVLQILVLLPPHDFAQRLRW